MQNEKVSGWSNNMKKGNNFDQLNQKKRSSVEGDLIMSYLLDQLSLAAQNACLKM